MISVQYPVRLRKLGVKVKVLGRVLEKRRVRATKGRKPDPVEPKDRVLKVAR